MPDENVGRRKALCFLNALEALAALKQELLTEPQGLVHREWIERIDAFSNDLMDAAERNGASGT